VSFLILILIVGGIEECEGVSAVRFRLRTRRRMISISLLSQSVSLKQSFLSKKICLPKKAQSDDESNVFVCLLEICLLEICLLEIFL
jgi:hypothetical protein